MTVVSCVAVIVAEATGMVRYPNIEVAQNGAERSVIDSIGHINISLINIVHLCIIYGSRHWKLMNYLSEIHISRIK